MSDNEISDNGVVRPPVLVACPECSTKFTVSRAAIAASSTPTFHCSKCDAIFSIPARELKELPIRATSPSEGVRPAQPMLKAVTTPSMPSVVSETTRATSSFAGTQGRQLGLAFEGNVATAKPEFTERSVQLKNLGEIKSTPLVDHPTNSQEGTSAPFHGFSFKKLTSHLPSSLPEFTALSQQLTHQLPQQLAQRLVKKLPMAAIIAPMIACILALLVTTWMTMSIPTFGRLISRAWVTRSDASMGEGLVLRGVNYSKLTLENGAQLGIISGSVYNGSGASIERATLEGVVFGTRGEELARVKSPLGSKLNKAKLQSLTSEMLQDMQSDRKARNVMVRPGEGHPFVIALPLSDQARSFSARILSAK